MKNVEEEAKPKRGFNMKRILSLSLACLMLTMPAFGTVPRQLNGATIATDVAGANVLTLPASTTDQLVGRATTDSLSNKTLVAPVLSGTITGTYTLGGTPSIAASSLTGQVAVANGGTGLSSGTSGGILGYTASGTLASSIALTANALVLGGGAGATPTPLGSLGTTTTLLHGNASGAPTFSAVSLTADVSGILPVANGGTGQNALTAHDVVVGNGTSGVTLVSPSTSGFVLTSNGTSADPTFQAFSVTTALNGGSGSPLSVVAGTGVTLSGITKFNEIWVSGTGGVTVTATPSITACTADSQQLKVYGTSDTNTVTLQDKASLASSGLSQNGNITLKKDSSIQYHCDITQSLWVEDARR